MVNNKFFGSLIPKFKINGTLRERVVENDLDWKIRYERDENQKGLIHKVSNQLTFIGRAYKTFNNLRKQANCDTTEVSIVGVNRFCVEEEIFTGVTYLKDVKFDKSRCTATAELRDRTFYGLLNDNKDVKVSLNAVNSKNGVDISGYQNVIPIDFPVPPSNTPTLMNRNCISVYDAFKIIVAYISDDRMTFQSDYFNTGDGANFYVLAGAELRTGAGYYPNISFKTLFDDLAKLRNLSFAVSDINGNFIVRVEDTGYFDKTDTLLQFDRVPNIKMELIDTELYNIVNVGSATHEDTGTLQDLRWLNSKEESYTIATDCGYDQTLDLVINNLVISSNTFELVLGGSDAYDDNVFLVETDGTTALTDDIYHLGNYILNRNFLNDGIVTNYFGYVPGNIAQELGTGSIKFRAQKTASATYTTNPLGITTSSAVISFPNDSTGGNFDPAGLWNAGTYRYTAATAGVYAFTVDLHLKTTAFDLDTGGFQIKLNLRHFDVGNSSLGTNTKTYNYFRTVVSSVDEHLRISVTKYMQPGDYININIDYYQFFNTAGTTSDKVGFYLADDSYIACTGGSDGGGIFETGDPSEQKKYKYSFKYPITWRDFRKLRKDPLGIISFSPTSDMADGISCWLESVTVEPKGGVCDWVLRSNQILE